MKYQRTSIVLAFFVLSAFLSCTEQESANPQEIAVADAAVLHAADIAEEANSPAIYQASVEIIAEQAPAAPPEPVYFQPLAADETLATLGLDINTLQILAISLERNAYRIIQELSCGPVRFLLFRFSNNARSAFLRAGDSGLAPLYHIDGENGVISYLFEVSPRFAISSDGRFIAIVPDFQANRNRVSLFSIEERDIVAQFEVTIDVQFPLEIAQEGRSNFRVFHPAGEWDSSNADGVLDTENLTLQMEERFGRFPMFEGDDLPTVPIILNAFPRLRYSLNLAPLPLPTPGRWLDASETVNVYSAPDFSSEVIQRVERLTPPLGAGTNFVLYEIGEEAIFDGISSHWAYVRLWHGTGLETGPTATTGWVFLGLMAY
jgi:hypothetical protein